MPHQPFPITSLDRPGDAGQVQRLFEDIYRRTVTKEGRGDVIIQAGDLNTVYNITNNVLPKAQIREVAKANAPYSDIQTAINSITDASSLKPYLVLIYPGVYSFGGGLITQTNPNIIPAGVERNSVIITSSNPNQTILTADGCHFVNLTVKNEYSSANQIDLPVLYAEDNSRLITGHSNMIDGSTTTGATGSFEFYLGDIYMVNKIRLAMKTTSPPDEDGIYDCYTSMDGSNWDFKGRLSSNASTPNFDWREVSFTSCNAKYFKAVNIQFGYIFEAEIYGANVPGYPMNATTGDTIYLHNCDTFPSLPADVTFKEYEIQADVPVKDGITIDGRDISVDGTKLDGIEAGAQDDQTGVEIVTLLEALAGAAKLSHDSGLSDISSDDHHAQAHTIVSHDTTATGANLNTLTDDSMADALHRHSELSASDGSPDKIVYVDAAGKLFADAPGTGLDVMHSAEIGTHLTVGNNITVGGTVDGIDIATNDAVIRDNISINAIRMGIANSLSIFKIRDGVIDVFTDETGMDTGNCINQSYDSGGDFYEPTMDYGSDILTGGTATADNFTPAAPPPNACDDNEATQYVTQNVVHPHWWKYDLGVGVTKTVRKLRYLDTAAHRMKDFKLQGSNTGAFGGEETDIYTGAGADVGTWQEFTFANATAYRYYRVYQTTNWLASNYFQIYELEMLEKNVPDNMTLISNSTEAEAEPSESRLLFLMQDVDAATVNTDILGYSSLDDGSNWETITLSDVGDYDASKKIIVGSKTLTDRNDQTMVYKIVTANNKHIKIHATAHGWKPQ